MKKYLLAALAMTTVVSFSANAAENGFYVVGQLGKTTEVQDVEDSNSLGALLGYRFNQNWGIEAGAIRLLNDVSIAVPTPFFGSAQLSIIAQSASAIYFMPVGEEFSILGRLGFHKIKEDISTSNFGSSSSDASGQLIGVAGQYNQNASIGYRVGIDLYKARGRGTIRNFNASIVFMF